MTGLKSSVAQKGKYVTQIIHFVGGHCKTIHGIDTDTIEQGQFTKFRQKDFEGAAFYFNEALNLYPDHEKSQKGLNNVNKRLRK